MTTAQLPAPLKDDSLPDLKHRVPAIADGTAACTRYRPLFDILLDAGTPEGAPAGLRAAGALVCSSCPAASGCGSRLA